MLYNLAHSLPSPLSHPLSFPAFQIPPSLIRGTCDIGGSNCHFQVHCRALKHRPSFRLASLAALALTLALGLAPLPAADRSALPCDEAAVVAYTAPRLKTPPVIDGRLDDPAWRGVPRSARYVDLISGGPTIHNTQARIAWDDTHLYLAIEVEEPFVRAEFTANNSPIYQENDVEVFIGGPDAYYEFEINARNTTYEVLFVWERQWDSSGISRLPGIDRARFTPFNGVGFTTHPRGRRLGDFNWHFPGMKTAVFVDGTLNDDRDRDRGWTVELAFPWAGMTPLATDGRSLPPKHGDVWRIDLSRFNTYREAPPARDSGGWALSPHRVWDSHVPECFPRITFSTNAVAVP